MKRWLLVVIGVLRALVGALWTLQELNLLRQEGGMNGQRLWAVVGPLVAVGGLILIMIWTCAGRSPSNPAGSR